MKETYYKIEESQFRKLTKRWYRKKKSWKMLNLLSWFFLLMGVAAIAFMAIQGLDPTVPDMEAVALMVAVGIILSVVPFCLAFITKNQAIRHIGKPYSGMRKIFLYSNDSGFQFGYHNRYDFECDTSMIVHQIAYENIHHAEIDRAQSLFTVVGRTERVEYEDMAADRIAYQFTHGQFGDMASFSFFLALENEQAFFDELKAHGVDLQFV